MVRHAFTMIELIFALVIMSIVFVSLPMVMVNNADSVEDNLIQESLFLASSKMSQILSFQWDNNSSATGVGTLSASDVVDVTNGAPLLDRSVSEYRIGHFQENKHRRMTPSDVNSSRSATAIGIEVANVYDDIDDFDGLANDNIISITSDTGYKKNYQADINVTYINDNNFLNGTTYASNSIDFVLSTLPAGATTNLKMVEISIDQEDQPGIWAQTLLLRSYVANIGETDYFKRRY